MRKTKYKAVDCPLLIDTEGLKSLTGTGKSTAVKIGMDAHAKVQLGRSVRWNVKKIETYLDSITSE